MVARARAEILAVVQARGGSVSIPRKNARKLGAHPLIAYSVAAATAARNVTRVIVSTDDSELAELARFYGAEVPFLRPAELARNDTPDLPLFQHALSFLKEREGYEPDAVVQLRPTSPLRPVGLVDEAVERLLTDPAADSIRSVTPAGQNPFKMWRPMESGYLEPLLTLPGVAEPYNSARQLLPPVFWQTGHIDVFRRGTVVNGNSLTGKIVRPIEVEPLYCVDIDNESDLERAAAIIARHDYRGVRPLAGPEAALATRRPLPARVALLVLDFDGVLTDNRVFLSEDGGESVACNRSDGLGLELLRATGVDAMVLSRETSPVVAARCAKLGLQCRQGIRDKIRVLTSIARERDIPMGAIVYAGNDVNDLECMKAVGCGVAVADAHPDVIAAADLVLTLDGGRGAVRELCDLLISMGK